MTKFNITVINTGGTFNKVYNPLNGDLEVAKDAKALKQVNEQIKNVWANADTKLVGSRIKY